jgi:hypothetical protein
MKCLQSKYLDENVLVKFNEFLEKLLWDPEKMHIFPSPSNISK